MLWLLATSLPSLGQTLKVVGLVRDAQSGDPLVGAHVMLHSNWRTGTVTDLDGRFLLEVQSTSATDSLIISYVGYVELLVPITPGIGDRTYELEPKASSIQEIEIIGERLIAEEFSVKKIRKLEIYKNPSAKADVLLAVNATPSSTTVDETANVSFRGSSPAQTGIFFNQVPVYDAVRFSQLNGIGTFSFFNTDIVDNLQIYASNPPLEFGNTSSGLVAIQSEDNLPPKQVTSTLLSLASVGLNHHRPIGTRTGLSIFSNYQFSGPIKTINSASLEDIYAFESIDAGIHLVHHFPGRTTIKLFNYGLREGYRYNFRSPSYSGLFRQQRLNNLTIVNVIHKSEVGSFSLNLGSRLSDQEFRYSRAIYDIGNQDYFVGSQYHIERSQWGLKAGIAYDGRFQRFDGVVPVYPYAQGPSHPFDTVADAQSQREILDAFIYYKYIPTERITIGVALRKNLPWNGQEHYLSRQVNIDVDLRRNHNLKLAAGTFHQILLPSESVSESIATVQQVSLDHTFSSGESILTTSVFYKRSKFEPLRQEQVLGLEWSVQFRPLTNLRLNASYTGLIVDAEGPVEQMPSIYDLPYFVRIGGEWNFLNRFTVGLRGLFRAGTWYAPVIGARYDSPLNVYEPIPTPPGLSLRYPSYNLVDLNASSLHALGKKAGLILFVSMTNAFNFRNVRGYSYSFDYSSRQAILFSRRTVYFGAVVSF